MPKCIFCKIIAGEIRSTKVYEDNVAVSFLDIRPEAAGHLLVIPREHYRWVWDIPNIGEFYDRVGKIANAQRKAFNTEQIISRVVGEDVAHAHVWLIPATNGASRTYTYKPGETEEVAEKIRKALE
ncbi:MAG: HIT domain-containing protein [Candidatus Vogelbacteria bacterium]|nr:HIT domain-containing protein [Candidatus Vogelbacteria bacterium]